MQTVVHVLGKKSGKRSLRRLIVEDLRREAVKDWFVEEEHRKSRSNGWAKLSRDDCFGVLNIEWDSDTKTLVGRAITRAGRRPDRLVGAFIAYILRSHESRIDSVTIRQV